MAILRWDPWGELAALQRDVNELFGRTSGQQNFRAGSLVPPMDAFTTDDALIVRLELPGLRPEQVDVSVQDGMLTVSGERPLDAGVADDAWLRRERPVGSFERSFSLPEGTDFDAISADFEHGVLQLTIPHPAERKPRKVQIGVGGGQRQESVAVGSGQ